MSFREILKVSLITVATMFGLNLLGSTSPTIHQLLKGF